jgi:Probable zinc-ribbon domain
MSKRDEYEAFVAHPRYGDRPRVTGLNPTTKDHNKPGEPIVLIHWHSPPECRIPNTAIVADIAKQNFTTFPVSHYFDVKRTCRDCKRPFLFFAEEQRHWYEELGFPLDADCARCVPCRKREQGIARTRQRYEELFHVAKPSDEELLEMAECCLSLIEASLFSPRQHERVRMLLNRVPDGHRYAKRKQKLVARVQKLKPERP